MLIQKGGGKDFDVVDGRQIETAEPHPERVVEGRIRRRGMEMPRRERREGGRECDNRVGDR